MPSSYARRYRYRPPRRRRRYGRAVRPMSRRQFLMAAGAGAAGAVAFKAKGDSASHPARTSVADAARPATPAVTPDAAKAIAFAKAQIGLPYVWGGTGPPQYAGFDCSGLAMMAWRAAGVDIARTTFTQWDTLRHIPASQLRPGDLIFYAGGDGTVQSPGHVVMYIGGGTVIQAFETGTDIELTPLADMDAGGLTGYARP